MKKNFYIKYSSENLSEFLAPQAQTTAPFNVLIKKILENCNT